MAADAGSPQPVADEFEPEESGGSGSSPNKRWKTEAEEPGITSAASPVVAASTIFTTPPPIRVCTPPYPKDATSSDDIRKWQLDCSRIREIAAQDPREKLPTRRTKTKPKDPGTATAVQCPRDKAMVQRAARSVVRVSSITQDNDDRSRTRHCSGIIMGQREESSDGKKKQYTVIVTCASVVCKEHVLIDPVPKLSVVLPNKITVDGQLLFFHSHYEIALLRIDVVDSALQRPSIGPCPNYGQDVFVLARNKESSLMVRHGEISWSEFPLLRRNHYMPLSCKVPVDGGPAIDLDGNVVGMTCRCNVISFSTIVTCIDMWLKFGRIARPMHGLELKTFALLDVALQEDLYRDHGIDGGFIVESVERNSAAQSLGILHGDVIVSIDGHTDLTLPQLEDYLISLGWTCLLNNSSSMVELKLEVYDLITARKRSITLPVGLFDV